MPKFFDPIAVPDSVECLRLIPELDNNAAATLEFGSESRLQRIESDAQPGPLGIFLWVRLNRRIFLRLSENRLKAFRDHVC
jgi:hypothetical protein